MSTTTLRMVAAVLAVIIGTLPLVAPPALADPLFRACLLAIIAMSWNMMAGAGLISLGHSAFWGFGAYVAILCANRAGLGFLPSLAVSIAAGALLGIALALVTGKLQGIYFAICTLALSEGLRVVAVMLPDLTGGAQGQYLKSTLAPPTLHIELTAAAAVVAVALCAWGLSLTRYHYAFRAMRTNESAAQMLGIRPLVYRVAIVALCGGMASLAGALSAWYSGYLDPHVAFTLHTTIMSQIAPILGGIYTLSGPLLGTIVAAALEEITRTWLGEFEGATLLIYGLALILCVIYLPQGIQGGMDRVLSRRTLVKQPSGNPSA